MTTSTSLDYDAVAVEAVQALSGAAEVRDRLLAGLSMGIPNLTHTAYQIKCRVKDHDALVRKIIKKRATRPDYVARDVTDIVGLRILTLHRHELPVLLSSFFAFVEFAQREPFSLFHGDTLSDALRELIIYTSPADAITPALIKSTLRQFSLPASASSTDAPTFLSVHPKLSQYSSIHVVAQCHGISRSRRFLIPLEVQIRTAFEDIWAEIERPLNYKRTDNVQSAAISLALDYLKELKNQLDSCSRVADLIHKHIVQPTTIAKTLVETDKSFDDHVLLHLGLRHELQDVVNDCVNRLRVLFDQLVDVQTSHELMISGVHELRSITEAFEDVMETYEKEPSANRKKDRKIRYFIPMEMALAHYWRSRLSNSIARSAGVEVVDCLDVDASYRDALGIYVQLQNDPNYENDPLIAYRIGMVLAERGENEQAIAMYREAAEKAESATAIPENHIVRMMIPSKLGLALWYRAQSLQKTAEDIGEKDLLRRERAKLYKEAFELEKKLYESNIEEWRGIGVERMWVKKRGLRINNMLSYALELDSIGEGGGEIREWIRTLLKEMVGGGIDSIAQPAEADTVREAAARLGDRELQQAAARRVLELLGEEQRGAVLYEDWYIEEMRADAMRDAA